ncbi:hypothetical protein AC791_00660 [Klebsiella sp. RIT-PI-d]|uniref:hypothetical protein n=1 Tax=Klebsiella sp. RIT-PI-d TaxID=1681196 RepID=UPI0006768D25|nr:hypothetical protein [Klebsiella sp. RIT-PI-d]KNC11890.1 hypothetical protein AC791_00660 [Klebsiella sp. RIT-PI-d]
MSKSQKEILSDLLIGEAVMSLIEEDEEVTFAALLQALTDGRDKPENVNKVAAYDLAIADVKAYTAPGCQKERYAARFAVTDMPGGWVLDASLSGVNDRKH